MLLKFQEQEQKILHSLELKLKKFLKCSVIEENADSFKLSRLDGSSVRHHGYFSDCIPSGDHSGHLGEVPHAFLAKFGLSNPYYNLHCRRRV